MNSVLTVIIGLSIIYAGSRLVRRAVFNTLTKHKEAIIEGAEKTDTPFKDDEDYEDFIAYNLNLIENFYLTLMMVLVVAATTILYVFF